MTTRNRRTTTQKDMFGVAYGTTPTNPEAAAQIAYQAPIVSVRLVREQSIEVTRQIKAPSDTYQMLRERYAQADREIMVCVCLDTKNRVLAVDPCFTGSLNSAIVTMREAFKVAMITGAAAVIFAHNHPSGDAAPSPEDVAITRGLRSAGQLLDIEVLDHIVLGHDRFTSLREKGMGWS